MPVLRRLVVRAEVTGKQRAKVAPTLVRPGAVAVSRPPVLLPPRVKVTTADVARVVQAVQSILVAVVAGPVRRDRQGRLRKRAMAVPGWQPRLPEALFISLAVAAARGIAIVR